MVSYRHILGIAYLLCFISLTVAAKDFVVVIDAGHGGHDSGAVGKTAKEKNINLGVALKLGKLIESKCNDVKVIYTRKTDVFVNLNRRAEIANEAKADLFISIHTNALAKNHTARGASTWTLGLARSDANLEVAKRENAVILYEDDYKTRYAGFDPNSSESYIIFEFMQDQFMSQSVHFASMIQQQFKSSSKRIDSGVHQAGFLVLRATSMPSVLIELGFISTPVEEKYLNSEAGKTSMANSIFNAFIAYKTEQQARESSINNTSPSLDSIQEDEEVRPIANVNTPTNKSASQKETPKKNTRSNAISTKAKPSNNNKVKEESQKVTATNSDVPVFKIQILLSKTKLSDNDKRLKGLKPVEYYIENGTYKYTYAASTNYNEVKRKLKEATAKFKDAFIIAFKQDKKMNVNEAIKEFMQNKNK
ncbi:MAG: N-acetylmuramoyl-L-alanine amidase [Bacteroidaceae bacterium]|nr:N-acetylmuramoyl-L-alanine amidase [Bacteroidaceae bacterium]